MRKVLLLAACLAVASTLAAEVPQGPPFRVHQGTTGVQRLAAVATRDDGTFVVVWLDDDRDGDGYGIFGRAYDGATGIGGPEFQVNVTTAGDQGTMFHRPDAAAGQGQLVVVWPSFVGNSPQGIFARRFDWSGAPLGAEFQVNTSMLDPGDPPNPRVAMSSGGSFQVVWETSTAVLRQRFDASGNRLGGEFSLAGPNIDVIGQPSIALNAAGESLVTWHGRWPVRVAARRFDASGTALGAEFTVATDSIELESAESTFLLDGAFMVVWPSSAGVRGRSYDSTASPVSDEFQISTSTAMTTPRDPRVAPYGERLYVVSWPDQDTEGGFGSVRRARTYDDAGQARGPSFEVTGTPDYFFPQFPRIHQSGDALGNLTFAWDRNSGQQSDFTDVQARRFYGGLLPQDTAVDPAGGPSSNGNGVLEQCETVAVRPAWRNDTGASATLTGSASGISGPPGATYAIVDGAATYGFLDDRAAADCGADCYSVSVSCASPRPAFHWDATFKETLDPLPQRAARTLHVGDSFADVSRSSPYYRFVETLFHHGVTAGCGGSAYCPTAPVSREQMAVFVLQAKEDADFQPRSCFGFSAFSDVDPNSPFCPYIQIGRAHV